MDDEKMALAMLGDVADKPVPRSLRIAGLYAAFYLEDPFLHRWFGLACFVSRQVHYILDLDDHDLGNLGLPEMLAKGNLAIYSTIVPAALRFRRRERLSGSLAPGFDLLQEADILAGTDGKAAEVKVQQSLLALCDVEQRQIVQPHYNGLPRLTRSLLAHFFSFRLGYDSAGKVLLFDGTDPGDPDQRCNWMIKTILPAFDTWYHQDPEFLRADCDRLRRAAGVTLADLP